MNQILKIRKEKGITQMELAGRSNIPQQTISAIENGEVKNPRILTMLQIAKALGCTIDALLEDDEQQGQESK